MSFFIIELQTALYYTEDQHDTTAPILVRYLPFHIRHMQQSPVLTHPRLKALVLLQQQQP